MESTFCAFGPAEGLELEQVLALRVRALGVGQGSTCGEGNGDAQRERTDERSNAAPEAESQAALGHQRAEVDQFWTGDVLGTGSIQDPHGVDHWGVGQITQKFVGGSPQHLAGIRPTDVGTGRTSIRES